MASENSTFSTGRCVTRRVHSHQTRKTPVEARAVTDPCHARRHDPRVTLRPASPSVCDEENVLSLHAHKSTYINTQAPGHLHPLVIPTSCAPRKKLSTPYPPVENAWSIFTIFFYAHVNTAEKLGRKSPYERHTLRKRTKPVRLIQRDRWSIPCVNRARKLTARARRQRAHRMPKRTTSKPHPTQPRPDPEVHELGVTLLRELRQQNDTLRASLRPDHPPQSRAPHTSPPVTLKHVRRAPNPAQLRAIKRIDVRTIKRRHHVPVITLAPPSDRHAFRQRRSLYRWHNRPPQPLHIVEIANMTKPTLFHRAPDHPVLRLDQRLRQLHPLRFPAHRLNSTRKRTRFLRVTR